MKLENKQVLLTGATGGIGRAIARQLSDAGARLTLVGRDRDKLEALQVQLAGQPSTVVADINTAEGRSAVFRQCEVYGLDLFVNAAGVMDFQLYDRQSGEWVERMVTTNLLSPMLMSQGLIPLLRQRPESAMVHIGSIFGSIGHPGFTAYCASKFGLRGFVEALQRELADTPIKVLYLAPRATRTDLNNSAVTALNDALGNTTDTPEKVAEQLMIVLADPSHQSFMGWPEKLFVRLNGLFPGIVHNALVKKLPLIRRHTEI